MAKNTICLIGLVLFCHGCSFFWEPHKGIACSASEHCPSEGYRCYLGKCRQNTEKRCGDLVVDEPDEQCDDGNDVDEDGCSATCQSEVCGDGVIDAGETCDDGTANSDTQPDACRTTCIKPACGDEVEDDGEECDAGTDNSDTQPDTCRTTCIEPACGDEVKDDGEECDGGGVDGIAADRASCDSDCTAVVCGDGHTNTAANETCDTGVDGTPTDSASCDSDCTAVVCGDGHRNTVSEECDDGNTTAGDGCDAECKHVFTLSTQNDQDIFVAKYDSTGVIQWVQQFGGPDKDLIHDIVALSDGSFYLGGSFCRGSSQPCTATFGAGASGTLESDAGLDAFVARYSASGELQWLRQIGGESDQTVLRLALGADDSLQVLGSACRGEEGCTTEIETQSGDPELLTGAGSSDIFWVRYNKDGGYEAKGSLAGTGEETAWGLSVSGDGDVYVGGVVSANPEAYLEDANLVISDQADIFVKELSGGSWNPDYIMLGSFFNDSLLSLWVDDEHMVLSGAFCQASPGTPGCALLFNAVTVATNQGDADGFIFWLNRNKVLQSVYRVGSAAKDEIVALDSRDGQSMHSLVQFCESDDTTPCTATIDGSVGSTNIFNEDKSITGLGYKDIAIIKSTAAGVTESWTHLASSGKDRAGDITHFGANGLVAVVGNFECAESSCFGVRDSEGELVAGTSSLQSTGGKDIFVANFTAEDYVMKWLVRAGGEANDFASSVTPLADGGMLVAGYFCASDEDLENCTATFD
jgi:cysteine-rich repeat protein